MKKIADDPRAAPPHRHLEWGVPRSARETLDLLRRRILSQRGCGVNVRDSRRSSADYRRRLSEQPRVGHVLETCLYVDGLAAAERFYAGVLGLDVIARDAGRDVFFRCGDGVFLLLDPAATASGKDCPAHGVRGPGHVAFVLEAHEVDAWLAKRVARRRG